MSILLELPAEVEQRLREQITDLDGRAREAMALDLFRSETISIYDLRLILGMTRSEVDRYLIERGEYAQSPTMEDMENDFPIRRAPAVAPGR